MTRASLARLLTGLPLAGALLAAPPADAQVPGPARIPAFGRSLATSDDTTALVQNPANVAFMPGPELRWIGSFLDERATTPEQGHAIALGLPLPILPLGTGLRTDFVSPPRSDRVNVPGSYQWLTWGLGLRASDKAAFGISLQRTYSSRETLHDLASWSAGITLRPAPALALAGVARDINAPTNDAGGAIYRSYDFGIALRPTGDRVFELGAEARWLDAPRGIWIPRGTLGFDLPHFGRLRGDLEIRDVGHRAERSWLGSVNLVLYTNSPTGSTEGAIGTRFGNGLGRRSQGRVGENLQAEIAVKGWREPGASEVPRQARRVRIESTPGTREHVALLRQLWSMADDEPSLDAVVLELRAAPAAHFAWAQELRDAVQYLRLHGKRVLCHLEDADGSSLYVCSAADRILVNPAGGLRFAGLKLRHLYFASLLEKIGVRADFVRIGAHKSAPEQFTRDQASPVSRADTIQLLQQYESQYVGGVASGRNLGVADVRARIAGGPFVASEAQAAGFVDGFAFDDQLGNEVNRLVGHPVQLLEDEPAARAPQRFGESPRIALVYANGDLVDGRSRTIPFLGMELLGSYSLAETLKQVRETSSIRAVVLRIDSPGGSAMAADVIWREVGLTAQVKPVVVSMGGVAASGGYYIAAPATRIFASPLSVTGSIGVFYGKADVAGLLGKIGVTVETYKTAPRADAESIFRPYTEEERRELRHKVSQFYGVFLGRVAAGRRLTTEQVDAAGQGRVWTGAEAEKRGLVDELGGLRNALEFARRAAGLSATAPIVELPRPRTTLLGSLLGVPGLSAGDPLPRPVAEVVRALGPFLVYSGDQALARLEMAEMGP
jgi:protease IV